MLVAPKTSENIVSTPQQWQPIELLTKQIIIITCRPCIFFIEMSLSVTITLIHNCNTINCVQSMQSFEMCLASSPGSNVGAGGKRESTVCACVRNYNINSSCVTRL